MSLKKEEEPLLQTAEESSKILFLPRLTFLFLGLSSLIGWNAILIGLDYFQSRYENYNVSFLFSIPMFVASNTFNVLIHIISKYCSINTRILAGLVGQAAMFIFLPIAAKIWTSTIGFYFALLLIFIEGGFISLLQSSVVAFAGLIHPLCVNDFFTGTGLGGVIICCIRMIVLGIIGCDTDFQLFLGTLIYVLVAGGLILITMFIYLKFYKSSFCKHYLGKSFRKTMNHEGNILDKIVANGLNNIEISPEEIESGTEPSGAQSKINDIMEYKEEKDEIIATPVKKNQNSMGFVKKVLFKIMPMPFLVWLIYVQTFMVFPGLGLQKDISSLNKAWSTTLLILMYNIGDFMGKYFCSMRNYYNKVSIIVLILGRFLFFVSFIAIVLEPNATAINTDWFAIVNMWLFALSNGYATSAVMVLAPEDVDEK